MKTHNNFRELKLMAAGIAAALMFFHFYYFCYAAFSSWHLTSSFADRFAGNLGRMGLFRHSTISKIIIFSFLTLTTLGSTNPPRRSHRNFVKLAVTGILLFFGSDLLLTLYGSPGVLVTIYIVTTMAGVPLVYTALRQRTGRLFRRLTEDTFNFRNETFPQEERRISNALSFHFPAQYRLKDQTRNSVINIIDPCRGLLVMGVSGAGKTKFIFRSLIRQTLEKGMALFLFDLKYDDLTRLAYYTLQVNRDRFAVAPQFYAFVLDDLLRSHRCNVLAPETLEDISDAADSAKTILFGLNRSWTAQQGDFFIESAINLFTCCIWFLRKWEDGRYCTLPHLIEFITTDYDKLFSVLRSYPETETRIESFAKAYLENTRDQLQGQIDSVRISLTALCSPKLYYLLSGNDFAFDINNPAAPKVIVIGSNPQKQGIYGAIVSLFFNRILKTVNRKGGIPCHILADELPSFRALGLDLALAQARENRVAISIGIQDFSQLRQEYGHDHADAIFNLPANLICGQVRGDSARLVSDQIGRILQDKLSVSTGSRDRSSSESQHLDPAVPASRIATLSSGEFVGITADRPDQLLPLKAFHARVLPDKIADQQPPDPIPAARKAALSREELDAHFQVIRRQVRTIVSTRLAQMLESPQLQKLIITPTQRNAKKGMSH
jgi:hypothetical protein